MNGQLDETAALDAAPGTDAGIGPDPASARTVGGLALLYLRHGDPSRALALGLAAMSLAPPEPRLALLVASAFLKLGDPEQALAALSRLDPDADPDANPGANPGARLLARPPNPSEVGAAGVLRAKALHRRGEGEAARAALLAARATLAQAQEPLP